MLCTKSTVLVGVLQGYDAVVWDSWATRNGRENSSEDEGKRYTTECPDLRLLQSCCIRSQVASRVSPKPITVEQT